MVEPKPPAAKQPSLIYITVPPRRSRIRRIGCSILVVIWFFILLTPCFCFALASQGEIAVRLGDAPEQSFRIWLVNESDQRGIGISRPGVYMQNDQVCVQTQVSFLLWMGSAEGAAFCDCYIHSESGDGWSLTSSDEGMCRP